MFPKLRSPSVLSMFRILPSFIGQRNSVKDINCRTVDTINKFFANKQISLHYQTFQEYNPFVNSSVNLFPDKGLDLVFIYEAFYFEDEGNKHLMWALRR